MDFSPGLLVAIFPSVLKKQKCEFRELSLHLHKAEL